MKENGQSFFITHSPMLGGRWVATKEIEEKSIDSQQIVAIRDGSTIIVENSGDENNLGTGGRNLIYGTTGILELISYYLRKSNGEEVRDVEIFKTIDDALAFFSAHEIKVELVDNLEQNLSQALLGLST